MFLPDGHDPDSLIRNEGKDNFLNQIKQAIPLHRFLFDSLAKDLNLLRPSGKTQLINSVKPFLQKMEEGSYKQLLIEDLARLTHIETHRLNQLLTEESKEPQHEQTMNIARTPMRVAVALLLQHPEIYMKIKQHINLELLDPTEHEILLKLYQQIASNPQANTATLIEAWRDHPMFESINKLAAWDHLVPEQELVKEFIDIMFFLQKQNRELSIRQLINKSRQQGLDDSEKIKLQEMLKARHL